MNFVIFQVFSFQPCVGKCCCQDFDCNRTMFYN